MEVIFVLSFLALIAIWVLSFIGLIRPKTLQSLRKSKVLTRKEILIGWAISTVILIVIISMTAPEAEKGQQTHNTVKTSEPNVEATAEDKMSSLIDQVKDYDKTNILAVRTHGENVLEIDLDATGGAFNNAWYLDSSALNAKDILVKIVKNNSNEKFNVIRFVIIGKLTDQYNKSFESPLFQLTYDLNEIKKINLDDGYVDFKMFLNFAKFGVRHPAGHSIYSEWCEKESNVEQSGDFCRN